MVYDLIFQIYRNKPCLLSSKSILLLGLYIFFISVYDLIFQIKRNEPCLFSGFYVNLVCWVSIYFLLVVYDLIFHSLVWLNKRLQFYTFYYGLLASQIFVKRGE